MSDAQVADPSNNESLAQRGAVMDPDAQIPREILSTAGNAFTCGQEKLGVEMEMVILASAKTRMYFENAYKPGVEQFPACYAVGASDSPSVNAPKPQSEKCDTCPLSEWDGKKPPRCQERRKLVGIRVMKTLGADGETKREPKIMLSVLNVFPTSVDSSKDNSQAFRPYLSTLGPKGFSKEQVVTSIKIESRAPKPGAYMKFSQVALTEDLGLQPALLVAFKGAAVEESLFEPKPKPVDGDDDEKEVQETAAKNVKRDKKEAKY